MSVFFFWHHPLADAPLSGECVAELFDIRKSLMEDYKLNPEIVTSCAGDIESFCKGLRKEGKTLHCLMEMAMKRKLSQLECSKAVSAVFVLANMSQTKKNKNRDAAAAKACCSQAMEVYVSSYLAQDHVFRHQVFP